MLLEQIKQDKHNAMFVSKNKTQALLLGTLLGEIERIFKANKDDVIPEDQIISKVKKLIENNIECKLESDNVYLECYLPKQLTEEEIQIILEEFLLDKTLDIKSLGK